MASPAPRFGTDGLRGLANAELTPELSVALGRAAVSVLGADRFLIGRDTRQSGTMLASALGAGMAAQGADVTDLGVIPTAGVAWMAATEELPGAMVSASHNPFPDNGIKLFTSRGRKLDEATQLRVEEESHRRAGRAVGSSRASTMGSPTGAGVGRLTRHDATARYATALVASLAGARLDGLSVVVDCANGAASAVAPEVLRATGASVTAINHSPDGCNINDTCGSTHPEGLAAAVLRHGADVGLALDGDADRVLAVDAAGQVVDGDHLIALCAADRKARGQLAGNTVVVTVMSNLGFRQAMTRLGIEVVQTGVGDRAVVEAMEQGGFSLGGEQSGHLVFGDLATTGDGILTGLQVLDVMARSGRPLAELAAVMNRLPQAQGQVRVRAGGDIHGAAEVWARVEQTELELGTAGRVLVRPSGTEPVVRVMVEAPTYEQADLACRSLCAAVEKWAALPVP